MTELDLVADVVAEVEETLDTEGIAGLYDFSWSLRGLWPEVSDDACQRICMAAYETLRSRRALHLVWVTWPMRVDDARLAADSTPLDFNLDPETPVTTPVLALLPGPPS